MGFWTCCFLGSAHGSAADLTRAKNCQNAECERSVEASIPSTAKDGEEQRRTTLELSCEKSRSEEEATQVTKYGEFAFASAVDPPECNAPDVDPVILSSVQVQQQKAQQRRFDLESQRQALQHDNLQQVGEHHHRKPHPQVAHQTPALYRVPRDTFFSIFPFHIILDESLRVVQAGSILIRLFGTSLTAGSPLTDTFRLGLCGQPGHHPPPQSSLPLWFQTTEYRASLEPPLLLPQLAPAQIEGAEHCTGPQLLPPQRLRPMPQAGQSLATSGPLPRLQAADVRYVVRQQQVAGQDCCRTGDASLQLESREGCCTTAGVSLEWFIGSVDTDADAGNMTMTTAAMTMEQCCRTNVDLSLECCGRTSAVAGTAGVVDQPACTAEQLVQSGAQWSLQARSSGLELRGQWTRTAMPDGRPVLLFLGSPRVATLEEMGAHGLFLSDIPLHDMSRDFVLLAEQRQAERELQQRYRSLAAELAEANTRLEQATSWLAEERSRSDALLYRMLPADIAADLREGRKVEAINYPEVTILFSDVVGFMVASGGSSNEQMYDLLNVLYDRFDCLIDEFPDVYKLETIGDAYFLVCNLTTHCPRHVDAVIDFAIRMQAAARGVRDAQGQPVQIRIGIHTGPVVGGVLGAKTPRFSVYGDTVNVASRMESHGLPGKIHISAAAYARIVDKHKYAVRERGNIAVKGRGNMTTYLVSGFNEEWASAQRLLRPSTPSLGQRASGARSSQGSFGVAPSPLSAAQSDGVSLSFLHAVPASYTATSNGDMPAAVAAAPAGGSAAVIAAASATAAIGLCSAAAMRGNSSSTSSARLRDGCNAFGVGRTAERCCGCGSGAAGNEGGVLNCTACCTALGGRPGSGPRCPAAAGTAATTDICDGVVMNTAPSPTAVSSRTGNRRRSGCCYSPYHRGRSAVEERICRTEPLSLDDVAAAVAAAEVAEAATAVTCPIPGVPAAREAAAAAAGMAAAAATTARATATATLHSGHCCPRHRALLMTSSSSADSLTTTARALPPTATEAAARTAPTHANAGASTQGGFRKPLNSSHSSTDKFLPAATTPPTIPPTARGTTAATVAAGSESWYGLHHRLMSSSAHALQPIVYARRDSGCGSGGASSSSFSKGTGYCYGPTGGGGGGGVYGSRIASGGAVSGAVSRGPGALLTFSQAHSRHLSPCSSQTQLPTPQAFHPACMRSFGGRVGEARRDPWDSGASVGFVLARRGESCTVAKSPQAAPGGVAAGSSSLKVVHTSKSPRLQK
ncbi:hypothetical protein Agub_g7836 [Astrephomene gubernaculifera]|uniref:guanylate cyclase n=1 Tax=Astrephomene gubernaculifera TaxID=47775 RepID=A0AAD3HMK6_9CHLO|nr:hypothetical protein Agub_g7836 [Astrephomene gubernaculifera]